MAVFTIIPKDVLIDHLTLFNIGTLVSFAGINEGVENTNYMVETTKGKFILTLFEGRVSIGDLPYYIEFMEYLNKRGIPAPGVIAAKSGGKIVPLMSKPSAITTFLPGAWPRTITPERAAAGGMLMADMHLKTDGFPLMRTNTLTLNEWRQLIVSCGPRADGVEAGLAAFLQDELAYLAQHMPKPGSLPSGAVHADMFPDNVFFDGDRLSGVIDFYFACQEAFVYDLMLVINSWCFDAAGNLDTQKSSALLKAYHAHRPLSEQERAALPIMGRAAAMRIIATRLFDLLNPKPGGVVTAKSPLEHVRILRFHQRASSALEYGVEA